MMDDIIVTIIISVFTAIVTSAIIGLANRFGQVRIYFRFTYGNTYSNATGDFFIQFPIDMYIEIQNTTREPAMIRDFNGLLVKDDKIVATLIQSSRSTVTRETVATKTIVYGEDGSYSFNSSPKSISRYELCFGLLNGKDLQFDKLMFRYTNEREKVVYLHGCYVESDKSNCNSAQPQYVLLKKTKKPIDVNKSKKTK